MDGQATAGGRDPGPRRLVVILGVPFDNMTMEEVVARIEDFVLAGEPRYVATANVNFVVKAIHDPEFMEIVQTADIITADGTPILWAARWLGTPLKERVAGSDLVPLLADAAARKGYRVFLLGGAPSVGEKAAANLRRKWPRLEVHHYAPPFDPLLEMDHQQVLERIRAARPHLLFVSLGAGKQEKWIRMNLKDLGVPVCVGVGATVDFLADVVPRAPVWMRKSGLEWLFRIVQEPGRMWKRYFFDFFYFFHYFRLQWSAWNAHRKLSGGQGTDEPPSQEKEPASEDLPYATMAVSGRLDLSRSQEFLERAKSLRGDEKPLIVDLSGISFLDSSGMGALVALEKEARSGKPPLVLCAPSPQARKTLETARLQDFFKIRPDAAQALEAVPAQPPREVVPAEKPGAASASIVTLSLRQRLDADTKDRFEALIRENMQGAPSFQTLELDLSETDFIDSSGLGLLIKLHKELQAQGRGLRILRPSPRVAKLFSMVRMDRYLNIEN